jgi:hypothetical protein
MEQILSWIIYTIINYWELVKNVARETMAIYDLHAGSPSENEHIFVQLTKGSNFLHMTNGISISFYLCNILNSC